MVNHRHGSTGRYRRAQCACSLGSQRLAGQGVNHQPGPAGRDQADTVCLIAGRAVTRWPEAGPAPSHQCQRLAQRTGLPADAARACRLVRGQGKLWGPVLDAQSLPAGAGY
jgi:hypothetical protein